MEPKLNDILTVFNRNYRKNLLEQNSFIWITIFTYLYFPLDFPILSEVRIATTNQLEDQWEVRNVNQPCDTLMCLVQIAPSWSRHLHCNNLSSVPSKSKVNLCPEKLYLDISNQRLSSWYQSRVSNISLLERHSSTIHRSNFYAINNTDS